jgi:ParB family transcriptional regulator, chromosome partitioning protein
VRCSWPLRRRPKHGVLTPISVVREHDGTIRVRSGQRRTLAARQAALSTVPVYVRPASGGDEKSQVAQRVAEQIVENDHRTAISEADQAGFGR